MTRTTLFRVAAEATGFPEPLVELVRAASPTAAARTVFRFWTRELNEPVDCDRLSVQFLREPADGKGVIYEAARREAHFAVRRGRVIPVGRRRAAAPSLA